MKKVLITLLVGAIVLVGVNGQSKAEMNFGVKSLTTHNSIIPLDHSMGSYFGADIGQNLVLLAGLDFGRLAIKPEILVGEATLSQTMSISYLQPHAGVKLYFAPRQEGTVSPYIVGEVFKSLASVDIGSLDSSSVLGFEGKDIKKAVEDILSPFGVVGGFGSEYYFSDNFGIGGEVGIQLAFMSTSIGEGDSKVKVSIDRYFIYSGFSFNFKF